MNINFAGAIERFSQPGRIHEGNSPLKFSYYLSRYSLFSGDEKLLKESRLPFLIL